MKPTLRVFVTENCPGCDETLDIAAQVEQNYAELINVEVIDMTDNQAAVPEAVFATPTFMLDGRIVSLGNPSPKDIIRWIEDATTVLSES